jgi:hypothetical protein
MSIGTTWQSTFTARGIATCLFLLVFVGLFAHDFLFVEPYITAERRLSEATPPVAGELVFENVRYEPSRRGRLLADLVVEIKTVADVEFNGDAAFSVGRKTKTGSTPWLLTAAGDCIQLGRGGGFADPDNVYRALAQFSCPNVELATDVSSSELWYPFDAYAAQFLLAGCVNRRGPCDLVNAEPPGLEVRFTTLRVEPQLAHLTATLDDLDGQSGTIAIKRRYFIRLVSVVIFVMVLIFLTYLVRSVDPKETMAQALGVFGGLWALKSLIVPDSIEAFPTLIDFTILTLFCVVFALLLLRISQRATR